MDSEVYEFPVSFGQRRVWLLDQFDPDSAAYLVPWRVRLDGPVDRAALDGALADVVARHEALRTVFRSVDGSPVQVVRPEVPSLSFVEVAGDAEADAYVAADARRRFDLATGPLLRATLIRVGPDRHVLSFVAHHVITDGWSFDLLFAELSACYAERAGGPPAALAELPIQYGDYALWQHDRWQDGGYDADEAYWRDELRDAPVVLSLPTDLPRPARQTYEGRGYHFTVEPALAAGLRDLAQRTGGTLFTTLFAAFATVVARYAGRDDLLIGVPLSGRTQPETERLVGLLMNTLAVRVRLTGNPPFTELLDRVRRATAGALAHQELPFEHIVEMLQPERSLAQSPVVQVMFALQEMPPPWTAGGVRWEPSIVDNGTAKLDLSLMMQETVTGLDGWLAYSSDLFTPAWVSHFVDCLLAVARAAVSDPRIRVFDVPLLSAAARDRVLGSWATGPVVDPPGDVLPLVLSSLRGPETAVVATDATLSRVQTAEWAGQIAAVLRRHGVGPDVPVGLCLPRTAALIPSMLGVWSAGGAYVPLDPAYPTERLRLMVADSGLRILLTHSTLAMLAAEIAGPDVVVLRVDSPEVAGATAVAPVSVPPSVLAYTIFTSGSTGRPKGVSVPRGAVDVLLRAFRDRIGLGGYDRLVAVTTLSFDIAVLELLLPLVCGGRVVVADAATAADGVALRRLLVDSGATALQATPATWRMLLASGGIPPSVRIRLCGGEALPPDLTEALTAGDARAWNVYGPTETTVWSAAGPILPPPALVEVGPPIAGTRMYVLDGSLRPVPPGVVGEVYLGGYGVVRGYHGRPDLTASAFLPDPYGPPGARLYRTGDLARWRENGLLDLLGRVDHQVKVRGFRIETGEIEAVLAGHDSVAQGVVAAMDGNLVAYVVGSSGGFDEAALRRHLRGQLPDYMIPALFVPLAELPLTPNGKVDRARLPAPVWGGDTTVTHTPPETPVQHRLVELWSELLPPTVPIGVHDNFFALGGHSLTATQLVARIRVAFGAEVPLRTLFIHPTVAELADVLEESAAGTTAGRVDHLSDTDIDELLRDLS